MIKERYFLKDLENEKVDNVCPKELEPERGR